MSASRGAAAADAGMEPATADRRSTIRFKLNLAGGLILLTVVAGWLIAYQTTRRMAESAERVAHTQGVIASIRGASSALQQAEAAHRDYLLSTQETHRQSYQAAADAHRDEIGTLKGLTSDNARQLARIDALERVVRDRIALLDSLAESLGTEGGGAAQVKAGLPTAQRYTTEIGQLLEELEREELALLGGRVDLARSHAGTARLMLVITGGLTLLVLCAATVLFNVDVSRQERDEHRLRAALRPAGAANEAKSEFLATVSHEIRTPLNAVSGMSELLLETQLDSEQTEYARTVHSNAEALSVLIGDLLDSSKIEAGQIDLESTPFDLRELVEGVTEILGVRTEIKGVELILDLDPETPWHLVGDRNRLRQVLMNLVGNAVKFTEDGEVTVRVRAASVDAGRAAMLHLSVIDTGIGIAPEAQSRIFERFVQAERSTVRHYGGTGLGLNISRSLLELMGGTLSLESELGRGSTFDATVMLPLADTQPPPEFGPTALEGLTVLLVDPNDTRRAALVHLAGFAGAAVSAVGTAAEALEVLGKQGPTIIVVDESLPDTTGLEFAKAASRGADDGPSNVALVLLCSLRSMMTGYVGSYGIATCVYKPVKQVRLVQAIRQAAGRDADEAEQAAEIQPARTRGGPVLPRILLVEDHRDNWTLATRILVSAGYDIDLAENGVKAVELASVFRYDLILMDVEMPQMDGIEATRQIRALERQAGQHPVPIVALTAHAVEDVRNDALAAGMDDYTTKPVQKQQLLKVCSRWIDARPLLLIADDSPENHVLLANYLSGSDYRLVFAYNGRDAVHAFEHQRISLVLLDIDMPVMNGYDAARAIRRARGGDVVPIVALTGYEGAEERQRCLLAGCTGYLSKAIHRSDLLATVGSLLGRPASRRSGRSTRSLPGPQRPPDETLAGSTDASLLPSGREMSNQVRSLLARRDFDALIALGATLGSTAKSLHLNKLETVSDELADAARQKDEQRLAWWGDQLAPVLREAQRLLEVRQSAGDTAGGSFDALARVATRLLGVPSAAVTLLDEDRLRIKGGAGLQAPLDITREFPAAHSLCRIVAAQGSPLLVEDARSDIRVRDTPAAATHGLVSYGGVPLISMQGMTLGAFSASARRPRRWLPEDVAILEELAGIAVRMLDMERLLATRPATGTALPDQHAVEPNMPILVTVDDDVADLLPGYVAARRENVAALRTFLATGDVDGVRRLGHNMKGSGEAYGLSEVSRIGKELEHAANLDDVDGVWRLIAELDGYLTRLQIRTADGRALKGT